MAHRGEERALGLVRRVGVTAGGLQLRDVVVDRVVPEMLGLHDERDHQDLDIEDRPVLAHPPPDAMDAAGPGRFAGQVVALLAQLVGAQDQIVDRLADGFLRLEAEQGRGCRVPGRDPLLTIHRDDRDRADLDERRVVGTLPIQLRGPVGDAAFQRRDVLAQLRGHAIERDRKRTHLVLRRDARDRVEVARGDLLGRVGE